MISLRLGSVGKLQIANGRRNLNFRNKLGDNSMCAREVSTLNRITGSGFKQVGVNLVITRNASGDPLEEYNKQLWRNPCKINDPKFSATHLMRGDVADIQLQAIAYAVIKCGAHIEEVEKKYISLRLPNIAKDSPVEISEDGWGEGHKYDYILGKTITIPYQMTDKQGVLETPMWIESFEPRRFYNTHFKNFQKIVFHLEQVVWDEQDEKTDENLIVDFDLALEHCCVLLCCIKQLLVHHWRHILPVPHTPERSELKDINRSIIPDHVRVSEGRKRYLRNYFIIRDYILGLRVLKTASELRYW